MCHFIYIKNRRPLWILLFQYIKSYTVEVLKFHGANFLGLPIFLRLIGMSLHGFAFICYFKKSVFQRMIVLE